MSYRVVIIASLLLYVSSLSAITNDDATKSNNPNQTPIGRSYIYQTVDGKPLYLYISWPDRRKYGGERPAFVSFHGGGWSAGSPAAFNDQSEYLVSRGMVAIEVQYRLLKPGDQQLPVECIEDAKSAIRWVRTHAQEIGVDPNKIAGAGGSAGGQMVAFAGLMSGFDSPSDDLSVSAKPNALILFNPAIIMGPGNWGATRFEKNYLQIAPFYHVSSSAPPTIMMSGTDDTVIPPKTAIEFCKKMEDAGVECQAWLFPGQPHGFFNKQPYKDMTLLETDAFLVHLKWIHGPATMPSPELPKNLQPFDPEKPHGELPATSK